MLNVGLMLHTNRCSVRVCVARMNESEWKAKFAFVQSPSCNVCGYLLKLKPWLTFAHKFYFSFSSPFTLFSIFCFFCWFILSSLSCFFSFLLVTRVDPIHRTVVTYAIAAHSQHLKCIFNPFNVNTFLSISYLFCFFFFYFLLVFIPSCSSISDSSY